MGMLVDGDWKDVSYDTASTGGRFERGSAPFRDAVSKEPGARFTPEMGRYHLYVSLACPWAHRTLIVRALKGLEQALPISIVDPLMLERGWTFSDGPGCVGDPVFGARYLYEVYQQARPRFTGRVTVPVLFDLREKTIVNNESAEIIRMMNAAFDGLGTRPFRDLYPEALRSEIDEVNERVYAEVNNGVYRAGFATAQDAYEEAFDALFGALDWLEGRLEKTDWLVGNVFTEADLRLFTTLIRFDAVYHGHFKCNLRRISDYPRLSALARRIFEMPHVADTVRFDHIKNHYYRSHRNINPTGIVPKGPELECR